MARWGNAENFCDWRVASDWCTIAPATSEGLMSHTDPHVISTPDALRELVGETHPDLNMKVLDRLDAIIQQVR